MTSRILISVLMIVVALVSGFRKLKSAIPIAGSCVAAVSAACHAEEDKGEGSKRAYEKAQWRVIGGGDIDVGHCGFSNRPVDKPDEGSRYVGIRKRVYYIKI